MIIEKIKYNKIFIKQFKKLPANIRHKVVAKEKIFKNDPLHPSLRLHELHGNLKNSWSITVNKNYRIIFQRKDGGLIVFHSVGSHNIYKNL